MMIMTTKKPLRTALEVYRSGYQNQYVLGAYVLGVYVLARPSSRSCGMPSATSWSTMASVPWWMSC